MVSRGSACTVNCADKVGKCGGVKQNSVYEICQGCPEKIDNTLSLGQDQLIAQVLN